MSEQKPYAVEALVEGGFRIVGPNLNWHMANTTFETQEEAECVCDMLTCAYRAGREAKAREVRIVLGVPKFGEG